MDSEDNGKIDLRQLHAVGIPIGDLPENPPHRDGCALFALITSSNSMEFAVAIGDASMYNSYRTKTRPSSEQTHGHRTTGYSSCN